MNYKNRQQRNKEKSQERLRSIVENYHASQTAERTPVRPAAPVKRSAAVSSSQARKENAAVRRARRGDTTARLRDTISDYRSVPMSKRKKRRRNILYYSILALVLVGVFVVCSLTVLFRINHIEVRGESRYSKEKIIAVSGIELDRNMFTLNLHAIEQEMEKALPYLGDVVIRRALPDGIEICVTDTQPAGTVQGNIGYIILDENSKVLEMSVVEPEGMPLITGAEFEYCELGEQARYAAPETEGLIRDTVRELRSREMIEETELIDVTKRYQVSFVYRSIFTCILGDTTKLDVKLSMIRQILESESAQISAVIDASDANRVYYRPIYGAE